MRSFAHVVAGAFVLALSATPCLPTDQSQTLTEPTETESLTVYRIDEILVTASRLPQTENLFFSNVTVASREDIGELSSTTAAEALTFDSGMNLTKYGSYGSLQTLSLRGSASGEVIYLLDGVPISDPQLAMIDLNWLPLAGAARVEAIKGGASSIYGSGAVNGVVNIVSQDAMPEVPSSEITAWTGSFDSRLVSVNLRRRLTDRFGLLGAYDNIKSAGWVDNSAYDGQKIYGKFAADLLGTAKLDIVGFRHESDLDVPGTYPGTQKDKRDFITVSIQDRDRYPFSVKYYHWDTWQSFESLGSLYEHEGRFEGLQIEASKRSDDRMATSVGMSIEHKEMKSNSVGERSAYDASVYAQREMRSGRLRMSGSLRIERNSGFKAEMAHALTAWFLLSDGRTIFARIDRNFMFPTFNDLYWRGPNEAGDPSLKTEHSNGVEAGALLEIDPVDFTISFYMRDVTDMILWGTDESCTWVKAANAGAEVEGLEITGRFIHLPWLEASVSYSVTSATDENGRKLEYRPSNVLAWLVRAKRRLSDHVAVGLTFSGRRASSVSAGNQMDYSDWTCVRDASLPHYGSATLYMYIAIDRAKVFSRIGNLFNDQIYASWGRPKLPSRSYELGISWELMD